MQAQSQTHERPQQGAHTEVAHSDADETEYMLVEAEVVDTPRGDKGMRRPSRGRGGRPAGFSGRGRGRGGYARGGRTDTPVYMPASMDPELAKGLVLSQLEFYFSAKNLCRDVFLRRWMDEDGFVPVVLVASFHRMQSLTMDLDVVRQAVRDSEVLELDEENDKLRLKTGWRPWLFPNPAGGFGVPRYIKVAMPEAEAAAQPAEGASGEDGEEEEEEEEEVGSNAEEGGNEGAAAAEQSAPAADLNAQAQSYVPTATAPVDQQVQNKPQAQQASQE